MAQGYLSPIGMLVQLFTDQGVIGVGFKINTYVGGTVSTPVTTYTDSTLTVPNTNPIIMGSNGRFQNVSVWAGTGVLIKMVITDALNNVIAGGTIDNIPLINDPASISLTQTQVGAALYPRTAAEIATSIVPTTFAYPSPDLRRYGALIDGATDDTTAINSAITVARSGPGYILHPGGNCVHASQILSAGGYSIVGFDRTACVFTFTGVSYAVTFTAGLAGGATSGTLNAIWGHPSGIYQVQFSDGEVRSITLTSGATTATWTGALTGAVTANANTCNSAWRITNNGTANPTINSSGYGRWSIDGVTITNSGGAYIGAGLEINACGYAYYDIKPSARITGTFKFGLILDGVEIMATSPHAIIDNSSGLTGGANVWITNGPDRTPGMAQGFSNRVTIDGQLNINGASITAYNIIDDGGSNHTISDNNCNGASIPMRFAGVLGLRINNTEVENALAGAATGNANILFADTAVFTGTSVGPCQGFEISGGNVLGADMLAGATIRFTSVDTAITFTAGLAANATSGTLNASWVPVSGQYRVTFSDGETRAVTLTQGATTATWAIGLTGAVTANATAAAMHQGGTIEDNWFRNNTGRTGDIDITKLSNSRCGHNVVIASTGGHYVGTHNDADGNILFPPQNGYGGGFAQNAYVWGDTRFRHYFPTGVRNTKIVVPFVSPISFDCRQGNTFQVVANSNLTATINVPVGDPVNGDDGTIITLQIKNTSVGALTGLTFAAGYKLAGAFVFPASGQSRSITFYDDNVTGVWYEVSRTALDTPN